MVATSRLCNNDDGREGELFGKRPNLSDLHVGRALENDADKVILMHRPDYNLKTFLIFASWQKKHT